MAAPMTDDAAIDASGDLAASSTGADVEAPVDSSSATVERESPASPAVAPVQASTHAPASASSSQSSGAPLTSKHRSTTVPTRVGPYIVQEEIGVGTFSSVRKAIHEPTGRTVALKILNRDKLQSMDMDRKIRREIEILRRFRHPHVVKLYEVIDTPKDIFLALEYIPDGELFEHIVKHIRLPEAEARRIFQQIISGVECCHHMMVVHRDLKPENLLLDAEKNVHIADFGLSNFMQAGFFLKTSCGSPNYAAPEVISGNLYVGPEVDVWSCGVILYALLCGSLPFDDSVIPKLFHKIKHGLYSTPPELPEGAKDLIDSMLKVNPLKRITIPEIRNHPWFKQDLPKYLSRPASELITEYEEVDEEALQRVSELLGVASDTVLGALEQQDSLLTLDQPADGGLSIEERVMVVSYQLFTDRKSMFQRLVEEYDPHSDAHSTAVPHLRHPRLYSTRRDSADPHAESPFTVVEETTEDIEAERRLDEMSSPAAAAAAVVSAATEAIEGLESGDDEDVDGFELDSASDARSPLVDAELLTAQATPSAARDESSPSPADTAELSSSVHDVRP